MYISHFVYINMSVGNYARVSVSFSIFWILHVKLFIFCQPKQQQILLALTWLWKRISASFSILFVSGPKRHNVESARCCLYIAWPEKIILNSLYYNTGQHHTGAKKGGLIPRTNLYYYTFGILGLWLQLDHSSVVEFLSYLLTSLGSRPKSITTFQDLTLYYCYHLVSCLQGYDLELRSTKEAC